MSEIKVRGRLPLAWEPSVDYKPSAKRPGTFRARSPVYRLRKRVVEVELHAARQPLPEQHLEAVIAHWLDGAPGCKRRELIVEERIRSELAAGRRATDVYVE